MPVCRGCGKHFPNLVDVEGQTRNLQHRKFCLECSPFGCHNTSKRGPEESAKYKENGITRICDRCGRPYQYKPGRGQSKRRCPSCQVSVKRLDNRDRAIRYKGGKCLVCGYDRCNASLEFHHLDPDTKLFGIGDGRTRSWVKVKDEADKCVLVCSNCHGEAHAGLITTGELVRKEMVRQANVTEGFVA